MHVVTWNTNRKSYIIYQVGQHSAVISSDRGCTGVKYVRNSNFAYPNLNQIQTSLG